MDLVQCPYRPIDLAAPNPIQIGLDNDTNNLTQILVLSKIPDLVSRAGVRFSSRS